MTQADLLSHYAELYRRSRDPVMLDLEQAVLGGADGGAGWTTRARAEQIGRTLELGPGRRLLDLGAGAGWPGLHLARTTGAQVTLVDVPLDGLRFARDRAADTLPADGVRAVSADGSALPFADASFDALTHLDVLC